MNLNANPREDSRHLWDKTPLFLFIVLTAVFFITSHDLFRNQFAVFRGVEEFNPSEEEALQLLAQYETGQLYKAATYIALGAISFLGMLAFGRFIPLGVRGLYGRIAIFFFLWCLLSCLWSFEPDITARKLAIFVMLSLAAIFIAQRFRMQDLLYFVVFSSTVYLLLGIASEVMWGTFRPWVAGYRFSGTIHPNGQGMNCALLFLSALFACARATQFRKMLLGLAIAGFAFLLLTKSRTPFGVSMACLAVYALLYVPANLKVFLAAVGVMLACAIPIFYPVLGPALGKVLLLGRTETTLSHATQLTGRTDLWAECWYFITQHPWLGYGYNSFWTVENTQDIAQQIDWYSGSAHSVYIDLWLNLGIIGLAAYLLLLIGGLVYFARESLRTDDPAYGFAFVLLLFSALHGAMESAFLYPAIYTVLIMALFARRAFIEEHDTAQATEEPNVEAYLATVR